jgi:hypothetical protein
VSAPPLPEVFGNYALGEFVEVVSPPAISWLPQTAGWWWLGMVLLGVALYYSWKTLCHWYRNRYRREAANLLLRLSPGEDVVPEVNRLLKLTALAAYSRERVASLSGKEWTEFLNKQCPAPPFDSGQARLLALGAYTLQPVNTVTGQQLIAASLNWVRQHERPPDD